MTVKVGIVMPSGNVIQGHTVTKLTELVYTTKLDLQFFNPRGALVEQNRMRGVDHALKAGCTHVMFIDSDMTFPPDGIERLLVHGTPIVGCDYPLRDGTGRSTAGGWDMHHTNGPLVPVNRIGCGFLLIDSEVFSKVERPWFKVLWNKDQIVSEDVYFIRQAKKKGYTTYVDTYLSREIGHLGIAEFTLP